MPMPRYIDDNFSRCQTKGRMASLFELYSGGNHVSVIIRLVG